MISRKSIFSVLFALLLAVGLKAWSAGQWDECDEYLRNDPSASSSQSMEAGSATVAVPCRYWIPRQSTGVQILCLVELALILLAFISLVDDFKRWRDVRRLLGIDARTQRNARRR